MIETQRIISLLLDPKTYPHPVSSIELKQTQMSFIFLTGEYVYKVKKPVDLGYLDYTTLEKRRFFCYQEVKLNKRLCPQVYLGVIPIIERGGEFFLGGRGKIGEYAVKMRQLPQERMMDVLLRKDQVSPEMVRKVAEKLAPFHRKARTNSYISSFGDLSTIKYNWDENFFQTEAYIGTTISRERYQDIKGYVEGFLGENSSLFKKRQEGGRIVDCHGDLHTAHICFGDEIYIFDCIEFNERFRYCDIASEVAFLAMDLDFHHRPDLSDTFIDAYISYSQDKDLITLLPFYKCYRAYVRGKVEGFKLNDPLIPQEEKEEALFKAKRYFRLSYNYIQGKIRPILIITTGLVGTGKTVLAQALSQRLGLDLLSSDVVRKELAQIPITEHSFEEYEGGIYSPEFTARTYEEMIKRAEALLSQGRWVIMDATFRKRKDRERARALAEEKGADFFIIETTCPEGIAKARLEQRLRKETASDARWEIYERQKREFEEVVEVPPSHHIIIDTSPPLSEITKRILERLEI